VKEVEQEQNDYDNKLTRSESSVNTLNMKQIAKGMRRQEQTFAHSFIVRKKAME
jgi:hypothetical protein